MRGGGGEEEGGIVTQYGVGVPKGAVGWSLVWGVCDVTEYDTPMHVHVFISLVRVARWVVGIV